METRESAKGQVTTMGNFNSQNTCSLLLMYLEHVIYIPPVHYVTFSQIMVETKSITIDYTPVHKSFNTGITGLEIATDTGAFATKLFTFATKISRSVAN